MESSTRGVLPYNQVNTQFADTITQLNNMGAAIGRTFKLGDTFADAQAGLAMRRILSNTASRSEILKLLENMQKSWTKVRHKNRRGYHHTVKLCRCA